MKYNEQQLLGAILLQPDKFKHLLHEVKESDFVTEEAKAIYSVLLTGEFNLQEVAKRAGFKVHQLAQITTGIVTTAAVPDIARAMIERGTIDEARLFMLEQGKTTPENKMDFLNNAIDFLAKAKERIKPKRTIVKMQDLASEMLQTLVMAIDNKDSFPTLPFVTLSNAIGRLMAGQVTTIAGRPGTGKSSVALQVATHISKKHKTLYITLEMLGVEHLRRMVSAKTGIPALKIVNGNLKDNEIAEIGKVAAEMKNDNLCFVDDARTVEDIEQYIKEIEPEAVIIDSINLMNSKGETERIKITNVTRNLKAMAIKYQIPIVQICQLNRGAEGNVKAKMSDIKESGSIEEDSDIVILMTGFTEDNEEDFEKYDNAYYHKHGRNLIKQGEFSDIYTKGNKIVILDIAKNRNGETLSVPTVFYSKRFIFEEMPTIKGDYYG